jgi:CheY-like chemotaxis protein
MTSQDKSLDIVHVDEDEDDRKQFEAALSKLDSHATLRSYGDCQSMVSSALEKEHAERVPDIIFVDINMPDKNGFMCLRELRHDERYSKIPIVMFSSSFSVLEVQESREFGANLLLNKPSDTKELAGLLRKLLSPEWFKTLRDGKK